MFICQFYRDHKLLLVLFRALAVMPITRSMPGILFELLIDIWYILQRILSGRITFSWKSKASIYAYFFYAFATIIVLIVGRERLLILQTIQKFDELVSKNYI